jgi:hypothetical protein
MTNESWLSGADGCTNLQRLLEGNLALREGDIDSCASHWKLCPICREAYPDAMARIRGLRRALEDGIRENFARLRHQYLARKHEILSSSSSDQPNYEAVLARLFRAGSEIQYDLVY